MNNIQDEDEWVPIVDTIGRVKGKALRSQCHKNKRYIHPVIHLHIFDKSGSVFLQKRSEHKLIQPGKWDTAVGGHIQFGDSIIEAVLRECIEELDIVPIELHFISQYLWESNIETEYVFMFLGMTNTLPTININEISDGKFWEWNRLKEDIKNAIYTPNLKLELGILLFQKLAARRGVEPLL